MDRLYTIHTLQKLKWLSANFDLYILYRLNPAELGFLAEYAAACHPGP